MAEMSLDAQERVGLCELFDALGPEVPTMIDGWRAHELAAHLVLREHDLVAAPGLVVPGPYRRFTDRRCARLAAEQPFDSLLAQIRSGPPPGFFRIAWVRSLANLNEFFVHHEDLRRANGLAPRPDLSHDLQVALWRNVRRGRRFLCRRVHHARLELTWVGTDEHAAVGLSEPTVRLRGAPGELLLYLFGRRSVADVDVSGPPDAVAIVQRAHFGM